MARNEAVGKARYELETDPTKLKKGLDDAGRTIKQTGAETEKAFAQQGTSAIGRFTQGIDGLVGRFNRIAQGGGIGGAILGGVGLGAGLSAFNMVQGAISGVVDKIGQSIDLASDKAEAASKANELFGSSYAVVAKASRTAATDVGLSSGKYLEAAGTVGNLITNLGFAGDAAASMSRDIVALSADMGSFNNAGTDEVVEAIGAAFRGETEPIRRFGVMLSAAKVEAKALELGLKDGKKPLTDNAKAMATYQLILEQTAKAQGDFARTAEGKANADRIRAAKAEEAWTKLGEVLTPIYQKVMPLIAETTTTAIDIITELANSVAPVVDGALQVIANSIDAIGDSFTALKELMDPTGTEAEKVTRAILQQAKALGLDGDAVVRYTQLIKAQAKAERDRLAIAEQIADIDATTLKLNQDAFAARQSVRTAIDNLIASQGEAADTTALENELTRINLQLQSDLQPYIVERERLTGDLAVAQRAATSALSDDTKVTGLASQAVADYNRYLAELKAFEESIPHVFTKGTDAVQEQVSAFQTIGTRAVGALQRFVGGARAAADALGPGNPRGVAPALEDTLERMFRTMDDAKDPWKQQWRDLAAWAKDPFSRDKFEDYLDSRIKRAMRKARESFGAEKQRWLEIARAYRYIAKNEWIDPMKADIQKIMFALRLADRLTEAAKGSSGTGSGSDSRRPGNNAAGTASWGGGWTWAGERGPELMRLPQGTQIKSNPESMRMASQLSGRIEVVVRDPDGGLARAGIGAADLASRLGAVIASPEQSYRRFEH